MKTVMMTLFTFVSFSAFAQENQYKLLTNTSLHDVVAPTVWATPTGGDLIQGMIYFDGTDSRLKFVGDNATPVTIGSSIGGNIISSGSAEKVERATVAESAICTSGSCVVDRYSGTSAWLTVTKVSSGIFDVDFVGTPFASAPSCTVSSYAADIYFTSAITTTGFTIQVGSNDIQYLNIICMGPQ